MAGCGPHGESASSRVPGQATRVTHGSTRTVRADADAVWTQHALPDDSSFTLRPEAAGTTLLNQVSQMAKLS